MESSMSLSANTLYFLYVVLKVYVMQLHRHLGVKYFLNMVEDFNFTGANASEAYFILAHSIK
jgi:hypothetical protein